MSTTIYPESPRENEGNIATLFTWEKENVSIDCSDETIASFVERQGVDTFKRFGYEDIIRAMEKNGYVVLPIYTLYHGCTHYSGSTK